MTSNYHTPHVNGAPLTHDEVNAPLGELDAAISALYSDSTFSTFNAKTAFGAVGDGVNDDTAHLQAMFDASDAAGKGVCYIPTGTYKVSSMLELPYPARIIGDGRGHTIINYTGSTGTVMRFKNYATAAQRTWVEIGGFTLNNSSAATNCIAIDTKGLTSGWVHDLYLSGWTGASAIGILVDGSYSGAIGSWWNTFERIRTNLVGTGIKFTGVVGAGQANENVVRDCSFIGSSVAGVHVDVGDNIIIERSDLSTAQGGTGVILQHRHSVVRACRFESCNTAIYVKTGTGTLTSNVLSDNFLVGNGTSTVYGIRIDSGAVRTSLRDNHISGTYTTNRYKDDTTGNTTTKPLVFPVYFTQQNIAASQTSVALVPVGADAGNTRVYLSRPYRVRGITARLSTNQTAGTLSINATIGGVDKLGASGSIGSNVLTAWQGVGLDEDNGSGGLGASITTNGAWTPTTDDITVIVWVEWQEEQ
jgi:hypothetical protein